MLLAQYFFRTALAWANVYHALERAKRSGFPIHHMIKLESQFTQFSLLKKSELAVQFTLFLNFLVRELSELVGFGWWIFADLFDLGLRWSRWSVWVVGIELQTRYPWTVKISPVMRKVYCHTLGRLRTWWNWFFFFVNPHKYAGVRWDGFETELHDGFVKSFTPQPGCLFRPVECL